MTKVPKNSIAYGARGMLGDTVYFRVLHGETIMCNKPSKRKKISDKQEDHKALFREAAHWARWQTKKPEIKALYAKGRDDQKRTAYLVAVSDFFNAPVIHYIRTTRYTGEPGSLITIKATDDFMVTEVRVSIHAADGKLIEKGLAERNKRKFFMWNYRATANNAKLQGTKIKVVAIDRPGNKAMMEIVANTFPAPLNKSGVTDAD